MTVPTAAATSAARRMIQRRALQCSFSSVFHLKQAGMGAKQAKEIENLFTVTVGLPIVFIGATGFVCAVTKWINKWNGMVVVKKGAGHWPVHFGYGQDCLVTLLWEQQVFVWSWGWMAIEDETSAGTGFH